MDFMNLKLYHSRKYMKYFAIFAIFAHGGEDTIHAVKILRGPGEGSRVIPNRP